MEIQISHQDIQKHLEQVIHCDETDISRSIRDDAYENDQYIKAISNQTTKRGFWDIFRENPMVERGKKLQLIKTLFLTLIPIAGLATMCFVNLKQDLDQNIKANHINYILTVGTQVGSLVHYLQRERDMTAMYVQSKQRGGAESRIFLTLAYPLTNKALTNILEWPWGATDDIKSRNKIDFKNNLLKHRTNLEAGLTTPIDEINYYTDIIQLFMKWFETAITKERVGKMWKALIAYKWLIECKEDFGKERALGGIFFSKGRFTNDDIYRLYLDTYFVAEQLMKSAITFQPWIEGVLKTELAKDRFRANAPAKLSMMRKTIREYVHPILPSDEMSTWWFDNMTIQIDVLYSVQQILSDSILESVSRDMDQNYRQISLSVALLCGVCLLSPIIVVFVKRMITQIQGFAMVLSSQADELTAERQRTNSLLYQMLPRSIAQQLKKRGSVEPEDFDDVSIFFGDIKHFAQLCNENTPMQIVEMLNELYKCFDKRIQKFDIYKIESIGDAYMVASGVPKRNGRNHAAEIAMMALDLAHHLKHLNISHLKETKLQLRSGIHSGPVVAGVVGTKRPRYCLFGDTVNTASRMETSSMVNRIQISEQTKTILDGFGGFLTVSRGTVKIKGKGMMQTYWLLGKDGLSDTFECMPGCDQKDEYHNTMDSSEILSDDETI